MTRKNPAAPADAPSRPLSQPIDVRAVALDDLEHEAFPRIHEELRIYISEEAFDHAVTRGSADTTREVGGVLVGVVRRDDAGPYVRVDTTIDALHAEEKGAELTFTHDTWQHIHEQMDTVHQGKRLLGWYHTHPGFGVFLSDRDEFIHKSFFDLPFQIALVYDPKSRNHGVFAWRDGKPVRWRRYFVGEREHVWDGSRESTPAKAEEPAMSRAPAVAPESEGMDWLSLALIGTVVLLLGGLGGWFVGTRGVNDAMNRAAAEIAAARVAGAGEAVRALNTEVLDVVRAALDRDTVQGQVKNAVAALDRALAALQGPASPAGEKDKAGTAADQPAGSPAPAGTAADQPAEDKAAEDRPAAAVAQIKDARNRLITLQADRTGLDAALSRLRTMGSGISGDERALLAVQRAALGSLYAELAQDMKKTGDLSRAARYLVIAAQVDPLNVQRYERALREFDKTTPLAAPIKPGPRAKEGR